MNPLRKTVWTGRAARKSRTSASSIEVSAHTLGLSAKGCSGLDLAFIGVISIWLSFKIF
jgi:hypothetical protein